MKNSVSIFKAIALKLIILLLVACSPIGGNTNVHVTVSNDTGESLEHLVVSLNNQNCAARGLLPKGILQCEFSKAGGGFSLIAVTKNNRMVLNEIGHTNSGNSYRHSILLKANGEAIFNVKQVIQ